MIRMYARQLFLFMFISWHGYSCVLLEGKGKEAAAVLLDPYAPDGKVLRRAGDATVVAPSAPEKVREELARAGDPAHAIVSPGEYDVRGVYITMSAVERSPIVAAVSVVMDGMTTLYLGGIKNAPPESFIERFENVDILAVSVGAGDGLSPKVAAELVRSLEPHVVIPLRYQSAHTAKGYEPLATFLKEMGVAAGSETLEARVKFERDAVRELEMRVMVLQDGST